MTNNRREWWWTRTDEPNGETISSDDERTGPTTTPGGNTRQGTTQTATNEHTLHMKTDRINYWTQYHEVPTQEELHWGRLKATT